jgi:RHS repeat-associated protein
VNLLNGAELMTENGSLRFVVGLKALASGYDANGNMTLRLKDGVRYFLAYDAENRLTSVSGTVSASFVYNGDGQRVTATTGTTITTYIGGYFEWQSGAGKSYYFAGAQRVAMRTSAGLKFLLGDHLGSTAVTASASGGFETETRYYPWGEARWSSGSSPTDYQFTGQQNVASIGLYYYNARWYDSALGRFVQADIFIPDPGNPVSFDRYSYVLNSPLRYVDPSGYFADDGELAQYLGYDSLEELYNSIYWQLWTELGILDLIRRAEFNFDNILVLRYEDGTERQFMIVRWDLNNGREHRVGLYDLDSGYLYGPTLYEAFLQTESGALFQNNSGDDFDQFSYVAGNSALCSPTLVEGWRDGQDFDINLQRVWTDELTNDLIVAGFGGIGLAITIHINPPAGIATYALYGGEIGAAIYGVGWGVYEYLNGPVIPVVEYRR